MHNNKNNEIIKTHSNREKKKTFKAILKLLYLKSENPDKFVLSVELVLYHNRSKFLSLFLQAINHIQSITQEEL